MITLFLIYKAPLIKRPPDVGVAQTLATGIADARGHSNLPMSGKRPKDQ